MYFNLATQGANFGANTATRIKINFNHQQSTKTDRQNIAPIYTTVKHKIVKAKRAKTAKSRKFKAKYTRIFWLNLAVQGKFVAQTKAEPT